jgi:hypothetical protein
VLCFFSPKAFSYAGRDLHFTRNRWHSHFQTAANPKRLTAGPPTLLQWTLCVCGYKLCFETFGLSPIAEALYDFEDGLISVFKRPSWRHPISSDN